MSAGNVCLQKYNTFALSIKAQNLVFAESIEQMVKVWREAEQTQNPLLVLGEGSNVLFVEDFSGTVMMNRLKGIKIKEEEDFWSLNVASGENWHELVCYTLELGIAGLENLALIPGLVGTAPIQNIGAYGVELKNFCSFVDLLDFQNGSVQRISASDCQFGYRESIFKHQFQTGYVITSVGLHLPKNWKPKIDYGDLVKLNPRTVSPREIFESVCKMRCGKLPDPLKMGNAGSFFKNPIISPEKFAEIKSKYPTIPHYPQENMVKLAAGWLIDRCGLKGYKIGGAAVHHQQALVIVNVDNATSKDIISLARYIRNTVANRFDVWLEPEVRFISATGEINAVDVLS